MISIASQYSAILPFSTRHRSRQLVGVPPWTRPPLRLKPRLSSATSLSPWTAGRAISCRFPCFGSTACWTAPGRTHLLLPLQVGRRPLWAQAEHQELHPVLPLCHALSPRGHPSGAAEGGKEDQYACLLYHCARQGPGQGCPAYFFRMQASPLWLSRLRRIPDGLSRQPE